MIFRLDEKQKYSLVRSVMQYINLSEQDMSKIYLTGFDFSHAIFTNAQLVDLVSGESYAEFGYTHHSACLHNSRFVHADLRKVNLVGADLRAANLEEAMLEEADLQDARLDVSFLGRAKMRAANLQIARCLGASLAGADLKNANLERANFERENLEEANLEGVNLRGANLQWASLNGAMLRGAKFQRANLEYTRLIGVQGFDEVRGLDEVESWRGAEIERRWVERLGLDVEKLGLEVVDDLEGEESRADTGSG